MSANSITSFSEHLTRIKSVNLLGFIGVASKKPASVVVNLIPLKKDRHHTAKLRVSSEDVFFNFSECVLGKPNT
ncbi:hypothetical protein OFN64_38425, partial [Escherichia coli]|nr:hypothetical protein [Escherichia coli]